MRAPLPPLPLYNNAPLALRAHQRNERNVSHFHPAPEAEAEVEIATARTNRDNNNNRVLFDAELHNWILPAW